MKAQFVFYERRKEKLMKNFNLLRQLHIDVIDAIPTVDIIHDMGSFSSVQNFRNKYD